MQVEVTTTSPQGWDQYVEAHPEGTAYHRAAAINIGEKAFGLKVAFLTARDSADTVVGVLPLVEQSSLVFGRFLVSLPFVTYGGVLADGPAAVTALAEAATELGRTRGVDHVELRHSAAVTGLDLAERLDKVSMILALPASETELSKKLGSKLRSQIRRADREQLEIVWGGTELLPEFYNVFSQGMHELGTPVYSRQFFVEVYRALSDLMSVLVVRVQGKACAAAIVVRHKKRLEVPWAAATPQAKQNAINMRMYWEMLCFATKCGADAFDFGRSTVDSGTYRFKSQWGAVPMQLHWHYWLRNGGKIPQLNHSNRKYALAGEIWKRMPLWCANLIGPWIARHLP